MQPNAIQTWPLEIAGRPELSVRVLMAGPQQKSKPHDQKQSEEIMQDSKSNLGHMTISREAFFFFYRKKTKTNTVSLPLP